MNTALANPVVALTILTGLASLVLGVLTTLLAPNLSYGVRQWIPGERRKGGRRPSAKSSALWAAYWGCVAIVVLGAGLIVLYQPVADRQRELIQNKHRLAQEIELTLTHLTTRLDSAEVSFRTQTETSTPVLREKAIFNSKLIAMQQATDLRQVFEDYPLKTEFDPFLLTPLFEDAYTSEAVRDFYRHLKEVEKASTSLLTTLTEFAQHHADDRAPTGLQSREVRLEIALLRYSTQLAQMDGWILLRQLNLLPKDPVQQASLLHTKSWNGKETGSVIDDADLLSQRSRYVEEADLLRRSKVTLAFMIQVQGHEGNQPHYHQKVSELLNTLDPVLAGHAPAQTAPEKIIADYEAKAALERIIDDELSIGPADPWNIVVAKAISRRHLGYTAEAVDAFRIYRERFAATDSTAELYSKIAQLFTVEMKDLGLEGGVYIFAVLQGSKAAEAGLQEGDIIINYAGYPIMDMPGFARAKEASLEEETIYIQYLRADSSGYLMRKEVTVEGPAPIGVGAMSV